jgi:hypothetical protein
MSSGNVSLSFSSSPRCIGGGDQVFKSWDGVAKVEAWESQHRGTV